MPTPAGPRLQKITMNFYAEDITRLEQSYGRGWSSEVREVIHRHCNLLRQSALATRRTLGDLSRD